MRDRKYAALGLDADGLGLCFRAAFGHPRRNTGREQQRHPLFRIAPFHGRNQD